MNHPLPVTILGGYLGAGKTTLVNQILRQADGVKIAVLVNEFGALPIDEDLIEARDDALISIAGGCICCSFGSDLTAALIQMAAMSPRPDHIIVEASGVAMPGAIALSVTMLPDHDVEGVCVLVDCLAVRSQARDDYIGDTITRQLDDADLVILSKTDLADPAAAHATFAWLEEHWPGKPVIDAPQGKVANALVLGNIAGGAPGYDQAPHADDQYTSVVFHPSAPCDMTAISAALSDPTLGIVRAKGYLDDVSGKRGLIQIAGGRCETSFPDTPGEPGVVCIGLRERFNADGIMALADGVPDKTHHPA